MNDMKAAIADARDAMEDIGGLMQTARIPENSDAPYNEHLNHEQWYAGLAVSPASFSQQLCDMQISLQRANTSRSQANPSVEQPVRVLSGQSVRQQAGAQTSVA